MNIQTLAKRAYSQSSAPTRNARAVEFQLLARISHRIKASAIAGPTAFPKLVAALSDNRKLWTALAVDVADADNDLPQDLRARIFYLAEFVQVHTGKVLNRSAGVRPLLEVNAAVLRGLSGQGPKS
ncbi:flagellar biosynthesis regulator FlaF [Thalassococcus lentus]|uniref:Flagellar biosynthesis regulator FlaF n=1 Tax=Thalassococcus lentus TaxID=1210524 RepID=A0ABT4XN08_9RHOB|nr:flagellar biosynthesis regulator FlaF [Thalassococcus lentus]MDA7423319.1 flagellar biosynthesis regulator FlaF [Thalassococcus lentus]